MSEIIYKDESYRIIGACMEVYNEMGSGFLEAVYQECLEYEFTDRGIPFIRQGQITLRFKERTLRSIYIPDFLVESKNIRNQGRERFERQIPSANAELFKGDGSQTGLAS